MRTSGKTKNTPGWPNLHRTGPETEKHIRDKALFSLSPAGGALFFSHLWINMPSHFEDGFSCYYLNKIEL